ncbi:MAG: SDR family oxidoreductase [Actinomycetia bacterium]|nr:SDR family oxidoreductase [Actinomycetes bacterium]
MSAAIDLSGKVAVVTGAAQGIGQAIATALAEAGATIVVADLNTELGTTTAEALGGSCLPIDVTDSASVAACISQVVAERGGIDIWVNNAGIDINADAEAMTDEQWLKVIDVNLNGTFYCCREVGRHMIERGGGVIVNIASMSGIVSNHPQPQCAYNTSKAGVIMLTKSLAGEWAPKGVRVNSVSPGYTNTAILEQVTALQPQWTETWFRETPMGRPAEVGEIARLVRFLASDQATFMTGSNVVIDGGYTCW